MDPMLLCPGKGLVLPTLNMYKVSEQGLVLILSLPNNEMSQKSPFAIQKALTGIGGEPKSIKNYDPVIYRLKPNLPYKVNLSC
ncbi:hypothetical protein TNCV_1789741 [Trichonephila clavipes]|nr:hypothetical protein TNCV_1789741 [Trichonephila clavipes]